jgi:uncharacterized protein
MRYLFRAMANTAEFRFFGELADFLPRDKRNASFRYTYARAATLKNAIEALGVPHTEVGRVSVNGAPATLQRIVREGDHVEVSPWQPQHSIIPESERRFLADAHLGGPARFLRMLGYDTSHDNAIADEEIRRRAREERRIVLTRDRDLLKCADIARGAYVHALKPEQQLREIAGRYGLAAGARPFTLCLHCNLPLDPADKASVAARLPENVGALHTSFRHCRGCDRVYWHGTHYERMLETLGRVLQ